MGDERDGNTDLVIEPVLRSAIEASVELEQECADLVDLLDSIDSDSAASADVSDHARDVFRRQKDIHARLAELRGLNLDSVSLARESKQETTAVRQAVDGLHLELQNLAYQERHLRAEIDSCEQYRHTYSSLPLISEQEYLERFPDADTEDQHQLMIARIRHEKTERAKLDKDRLELARQQKTLMAENLRRRQALANIDRDVTKYIDTAAPITKTFEKDF